MLRSSRVLLLCSDPSASAAFRLILAPHAILVLAGHLPEALDLLAKSPFDAVLCAWRFDLGTWNDALSAVKRAHPDLPVIVFSSTGGEREWVEVLDAGAFDLLVSPYTQRTILPPIEHALASHEARVLRRQSREKPGSSADLKVFAATGAGGRGE